MPLIVIIAVVPVPGGKNHGVVISVIPKPCANSRCHCLAALNTERSALAEVVLHIDNQ
jgi:hypothetical protein